MAAVWLIPLMNSIGYTESNIYSDQVTIVTGVDFNFLLRFHSHSKCRSSSNFI
ncbi:hypothetical protein Pan54_48190 [Rubinisphaera italica]|uniref:Uncharacterized protein n=1 Tax=Rubinisphaera italica TaxID=2527969 RepID=A0A5C5XMX0_9PLAN|nr:hypothetical protein Pan54_48190 [Rubinisphaera italica]